ncbi:MAG: polyprenyl synthetase family protein [Chlamydiia bacterium]|nr:polyprenyl synthetase family protein [Chlamydiia bacterium]
METRAHVVESRLNELVTDTSSSYRSLLQAARYSLLGGGKRIRPLLLLATVETLGGDYRGSIDVACALEIIHTYSLIHDDLPCMDNDDLRRGRPTLHKAFSDAHAVLAGDYLLTRAFGVIAEDSRLTDMQKVKLTALFSKLAGSEGMIGGQVIDLEAVDKIPTASLLEEMCNLKTGALIRAAVSAGALLCNANPATEHLLEDYSRCLGFAFQIVDDILDITSTTEEIGKPAHSDEHNGKTTYALVVGVDKAKEKAVSLIEEALKALDEIKTHTSLLHELAYYCIARTK